MADGILDLLGKRGISLFGVSEPERDSRVPPEFTPGAILKGTRSVLCFAFPIPKGILHAETHSSLLFWRFCNISYRRLDTVANEICASLEAQGHDAVPIYSCFPWKTHRNKFYGLLPLPNWAEKCGIGRVTKSGLLGNTRFGTRVLLGGVITSASLEKTAVSAEDPCPPQCNLCQQACPVDAIERGGQVNHSACIRRSGVNPLLSHLLADKLTSAKFEFDTLVNTISIDDHGMYTCSKCLEVCPLNH